MWERVISCTLHSKRHCLICCGASFQTQLQYQFNAHVLASMLCDPKIQIPICYVITEMSPYAWPPTAICIWQKWEGGCWGEGRQEDALWGVFRAKRNHTHGDCGFLWRLWAAGAIPSRIYFTPSCTVLLSKSPMLINVSVLHRKR